MIGDLDFHFSVAEGLANPVEGKRGQDVHRGSVNVFGDSFQLLPRVSFQSQFNSFGDLTYI